MEQRKMKQLKRRRHEHGQHINGGTFGKQRTNKTTSTMDDPYENLTTSSETHRTTNGTGRRTMKNPNGQTDNKETSQTHRAQKDTNIGNTQNRQTS